MTRKLQWFIIAWFLCAIPLHAQVTLFEFALGIGGTGRDSGYSIVTDASGNIYLSGTFQGTMDADPGEGVYNLTSKGETEVYILKLDAQKKLLWAKSIEGSRYSENETLVLDALGNLFLSFKTDFGMFVQYLDTDGNIVWERFIQRSSPKSVVTDASGNVYITGEFAGTVDFDPGEGTFFKMSEGPSNNGFVMKLDGAGNFLWVKSSASTFPTSLTTDDSGNLYVTGVFSGTVDFDPGTENTSLTAIGHRIFVQKLDTHGNLLWVKMVDGDYENSVSHGHPSITTDISGNVLVTGKFNNSIDFNPGEDTFIITVSSDWTSFILKLDNNGNFLWAKANKYNNSTSLSVGNDIIADTIGNVYTVGYFEGTIDFDPSEETSTNLTAGGYDLFVQKLDAEGKLLWVKNCTGAWARGFCITKDILDNIYVSGDFYSHIDFDPSEDIYELSSNGNSGDAFILKLSQCIPTAPVPVAQLEDLRGECAVEKPAAPTASNNCGETFTATTDAVFPITTPGTTIITWTFTDPHGHTVTQQQKVIIEDVTAPVPDLAQLEDLHRQCALDTDIAPTATDNCGKVYTGTADVSFPVTTPGTTLITWTFEDEWGNQSTQTQKVILEDTTPPVPVVEHLADLISSCSAAMPTPPSATDNCDQSLTATTTTAFPITTPGTNVVQWLFADQAGNTATQTQNIIVEEPLVPEICLVTVDEQTGRNKLIWTYDSDNAERFGVYRETNVAHEYTLITYVERDMLKAYIDQQSLPAQKSNRYKISVVDSCGFESDLSQAHKTIHLTISKGVDNSWNLIWDGYEGISFGTYRIYRAVGEQEMSLLTEIASNLTSFTDTEVPAGKVAYRIEVMNPVACGENVNGRMDQAKSIRSNVARSSVVTDIEESLGEHPYRLYPNPVEGILQIDIGKSKEVKVSIWNSSGKLISSFTSSQQITSIDMSGYAAGVYLVKVNEQFSQKIVKE